MTSSQTTPSKKNKSLDGTFGCIAFLLLIGGAFLAFSNLWIAKNINEWQMAFMGDNKYFPAGTMFAIALPPLLVLLIIKKIVLAIRKK